GLLPWPLGRAARSDLREVRREHTAFRKRCQELPGAEDTAPLRRRHRVAELRTPGVHATLTRLRRLRTPHGRDRPARQRRPGLTTRTPTSEVTTLTRSPASAPSTTPHPTGVSRPPPYGSAIAHPPGN